MCWTEGRSGAIFVDCVTTRQKRKMDYHLRDDSSENNFSPRWPSFALNL